MLFLVDQDNSCQDSAKKDTEKLRKEKNHSIIGFRRRKIVALHKYDDELSHNTKISNLYFNPGIATD